MKKGLRWSCLVAGAAVALLSSWPVSVLRAAMSKLVEPSEQGELRGGRVYKQNDIKKRSKMEHELLERLIQGKQMIGELDCLVRGRLVNRDIKKNQDSILLPVMIYGHETWMAIEGGFIKD